jgi:adenine phosphoribosyltransferase
VSRELADLIASHIVDVADWPLAGVTFKDITPLLANAAAFHRVVEALAERADGVDVVAGVEARGFVIAAPVALAVGAAFVPVRKAGKLPRATVDASYALEYGTATLQMHADAVHPGQRVLVVDDVLATGGTAVAAAGLATQLGAEVTGLAVLLELGFLGGRERVSPMPVTALLRLP